MIDRHEVAEDLIISEELLVESTRTPQLHNKYNVLWLNLSNQLARYLKQLKSLTTQKWEYYSGKASPEIYKEKPFQIKVIKTDLHFYLEQDEELSELTLKIECLKNELKFVEETLKQINQRTFHIKNSMDYLKFINGIN